MSAETDHPPLAVRPEPSMPLAIGLCTYRRLPSLLRCLEHVVAAVTTLRAASLPQMAVAGTAEKGAPVAVIVVDNDGDDPAVEAALTELGQREAIVQAGITVQYRIERTPGISAARNAVFTTADALGAHYMAMLDDDEWPDAAWLVALLTEQARTRAVVTGGPVRPVFPDSAAHLRPHARWWSVQRQFLEGRPFVFCTCNFLIDLVAIRSEARPLFDEAFGLTGGGDTVFFRGLFQRGHAMAWSEEALLFEEVPVSRASYAWMRQRRYRVGNHAVRWEELGGKGLRTFLKTCAITARLVIYPALNREPEDRWLGWLLEADKVRGRWAAHVGSHFAEYARPAAGKASAGQDADSGKACR